MGSSGALLVRQAGLEIAGVTRRARCVRGRGPSKILALSVAVVVMRTGPGPPGAARALCIKLLSRRAKQFKPNCAH